MSIVPKAQAQIMATSMQALNSRCITREFPPDVIPFQESPYPKQTRSDTAPHTAHAVDWETHQPGRRCLSLSSSTNASDDQYAPATAPMTRAPTCVTWSQFAVMPTKPARTPFKAIVTSGFLNRLQATIMATNSTCWRRQSRRCQRDISGGFGIRNHQHRLIGYQD